MIEKIKEEIKSLLGEFTVANGESRNTELEFIGSEVNPLNPDLMAYCFDEILGFNVCYRIAEKVNYCIDFKYKDSYGYILHKKMSYKLFIQTKYKDEILDILSNVRSLLEQLFTEISISSIAKNNFTMKNEFYYFDEKFKFYKNKIYELNEYLGTIGPSKPVNYIDFLNGVRDENNFKRRQTHLEIQYSIEVYIDTFFSFAEHVLTLLYPFLRDFNSNDSYGNYLYNSRWNWMKKIEDIFGHRIDEKLTSSLREIKEIYRNRNAHGFFSRELEVYVGIDNFGQFPLYIGKNYLKGFVDDYDLSLDYNKFLEIDEKFVAFFKSLDELFQLPMMYIRSGLPVQANIKEILKEITSKESLNDYLDRYSYELDNQINMDW
jgi:hypothetical protein